jgi:predicted dehydrogenase
MSAPGCRPATGTGRADERGGTAGAAGVGYGASFANQAADLLSGWPAERWTPGFADGAAAQAVCDAMETSAAGGRWVSVGEVTASPL